MDAARRADNPPDPPPCLSALYDTALPEVYGYLRARAGSTQLAEELTSATFVQAALSMKRNPNTALSVGWLITVARNKLIDHWRRQAVAARSLQLLEGGNVESVEPWDEVLDHARATTVLQNLQPQYRSVLTLRYLDDLSVAECADVMQRSVRATESLLARARTAFRTEYEETGGNDD